MIISKLQVRKPAQKDEITCLRSHRSKRPRQSVNPSESMSPQPGSAGPLNASRAQGELPFHSSPVGALLCLVTVPFCFYQRKQKAGHISSTEVIFPCLRGHFRGDQ